MPLACPGNNQGVLPQVATGLGIASAATQDAANSAAQQEAEAKAIANALGQSANYPCPGPCTATYTANITASGASPLANVDGGGLFNAYGWAKAQLNVACAQSAVSAPSVTAVEDKLKALCAINDLIAIPVPQPELSVFIGIRESIKAALLSEITALTTTPAATSQFWTELLQFATAVLAATIVEKAVEKIGGGLLGPVIGAIVHNLLDPTPIGGVDTETLDSLDVITPPTCYRITWYRTKYSDELIWGPVRIKIETIPCPPPAPKPGVIHPPAPGQG